MKTTKTTVPRNMGWAAGAASTGNLEFREPDLPGGYDDEERAAFRDGYLEGRAWQLGTDHGTSGETPFGDMDAGGEALLMDALGETGWTTQDNYPLRLGLLETYKDARESASRNAGNEAGSPWPGTREP